MPTAGLVSAKEAQVTEVVRQQNHGHGSEGKLLLDTQGGVGPEDQVSFLV